MGTINLPTSAQLDNVIKTPIESLLLNNVSALCESTVVTATGYSSAIIEVTGTFVGEIAIRGRAESTYYRLPIFKNGIKYDRINAPGIYYVDLTGYNSIKAAVESYTSGTIKVFGRFTANPLIAENTDRKRIFKIASDVNIPIAANTKTEMFSYKNYELEGYAYIWVGVIPVDSPTLVPYEVTMNWYMSSLSAFVKDKVLLSDNIGNVTDWLEVKAPMATISLENKDTVTRNFRIVLYGVK